ncbi:hypothetical protein D3C84_828620 [compost metagenome]
MGDARIDQPRLLLAGEDSDGKSEPGLGAGQENRCVAGLAHRTGRHRTHAALFEASQALAEALQRQPAALQGAHIQGIVLQAFGQAHRFAKGFHLLDDQTLIAQHLLANRHAKRVGAEIDGRKQRGAAFHARVPDDSARLADFEPGPVPDMGNRHVASRCMTLR